MGNDLENLYLAREGVRHAEVGGHFFCLVDSSQTGRRTV